MSPLAKLNISLNDKKKRLCAVDIDDFSATGRSLKLKFTAEPVIARKRRLATEQELNRKRKLVRKLPNKSEKGNTKGGAVKSKEQLSPSNSKTNTDEKSTASNTSSVQNDDEDKDYTKLRNTSEGKNTSEINNGEGQTGKADNSNEKTNGDDDDSLKMDAGQQASPDNSNPGKLKSVDEEIETEVVGDVDGREDGCEGFIIKEETVEIPAETVEIRDLTEVASEVVAYEQPYHDHCYTTLEGRKRPLSEINDDFDGFVDDGNEDNCNEYSEERSGEKPKKLRTYDIQTNDDIAAQVNAVVQSTELDNSQTNESLLQLKARANGLFLCR